MLELKDGINEMSLSSTSSIEMRNEAGGSPLTKAFCTMPGRQSTQTPKTDRVDSYSIDRSQSLLSILQFESEFRNISVPCSRVRISPKFRNNGLMFPSVEKGVNRRTISAIKAGRPTARREIFGTEGTLFLILFSLI